MVGEAEGAAEHSRRGHVAHERLVAQRELRALVAGAPRADTAARIRHGERLAAPSGADQLHRVDDLDVAGAPAEVAEQSVFDLVARRARVLREERLALEHDPRRAEPALRRAGGNEAVGPEAPGLVGEPFVRDDVLALDPCRLLRTRDDRVAVDDHRACAA